MKYCKKCLEPDTRPNNIFNKEGVCKACEYFEASKKINWVDRYETLENLILEYGNSSKSKSRFDCIIGVSGGKDSTRQALWAREKLKLKPLLVCLTYPPEQLTERGARNISNLIDLGFDVHTLALSPQHWKKLLDLGFSKFTNIAKSAELALFSTVPRLAIKYKIPLILWGENPALQLGDLGALSEKGYDGNNLRNINTLSGADYQWMLESGFTHKDLIGYYYPIPEDFYKNNIQIIYLGWFIKDWSSIDNALHSCLYGLSIRSASPLDTGDIFSVTSLDDDWVTFNQMIKYLKFGFGATTEQMNEEIRKGKISREEAIKIVEKYDGKCNKKYIESFCEYLGISSSEFWHKVESAINKKLFETRWEEESLKIIPKFKIGFGL